jgi:enoyl-CoA hydratase/carnithine racemase
MPQAFYDQRDDVGEIVLDAPPLNLFGPAMFDDLEAAIAQARPPRRAP